MVGRRDFRGAKGGGVEVFAVMVAVAYWRGRRVEDGVLVVRRREVRAAREGRCSRGGMVGNLFWGGVSSIEAFGRDCGRDVQWKLRGVVNW